jgi:hypothetical protein
MGLSCGHLQAARGNPAFPPVPESMCNPLTPVSSCSSRFTVERFHEYQEALPIQAVKPIRSLSSGTIPHTASTFCVDDQVD